MPAEADVIGKQLSAIRREQDGLVLGIVQSSGVNLGIGGDPVVAAGDQLLIATVERSVRGGRSCVNLGRSPGCPPTAVVVHVLEQSEPLAERELIHDW